VKKTVSDEAREDQWGVRSIDKVVYSILKRAIINYFKEDRLGGRAIMTIGLDEERVL